MRRTDCTYQFRSCHSGSKSPSTFVMTMATDRQAMGQTGERRELSVGVRLWTSRYGDISLDRGWLLRQARCNNEMNNHYCVLLDFSNWSRLLFAVGTCTQIAGPVTVPLKGEARRADTVPFGQECQVGSTEGVQVLERV